MFLISLGWLYRFEYVDSMDSQSHLSLGLNSSNYRQNQSHRTIQRGREDKTVPISHPDRK